MKWVTREGVKVDRVACPWLIRKFIDPGAIFIFVPPERVEEVARREQAIPFDVGGVELRAYSSSPSWLRPAASPPFGVRPPRRYSPSVSPASAFLAWRAFARPRADGLTTGIALSHYGKECSFEAILKKYRLTADPALVLLGKIVNGADTDNALWNQPEGPGLEAIAEGFRHLGLKDDHEIIEKESIVYDALYAYCREMVRRGKPDGNFKDSSAWGMISSKISEKIS